MRDLVLAAMTLLLTLTGYTAVGAADPHYWKPEGTTDLGELVPTAQICAFEALGFDAAFERCLNGYGWFRVPDEHARIWVALARRVKYEGLDLQLAEKVFNKMTDYIYVNDNARPGHRNVMESITQDY